MKHFAAMLILSVALICAVSTVSARDIRTAEKNAPGDVDIKQVSLEADIGVAELFLMAHDDGDIYTAEARYDADKIDVVVEYDQNGSSADLFLSSEKIDNDLDIDTDDARWDISLSRGYTWDIELDMGVTEADIDLSGLPIDMLKLDHGVSECRIVFTERNPLEMRRLVVDAGVGDLELAGLGYANAEDMYFDGGTGEFVLNFTGQNDGYRTAHIDVGVGSVTIELPRNLPVRIDTEEGWLNSVTVPKRHFDEIDDDVYETDGYETASYGLEIRLDIGIGSAEIKIRD
jgi:hypothetical protein